MAISVRNILEGNVKRIKKGDILVEVTLVITKDQEIKIVVPNKIVREIRQKNLEELVVEIDSRAIAVLRE
ncbi:MAG: hypothetical protein ACTSSP_11845 [Candidatus Asgardarchaeia archaeon]